MSNGTYEQLVTIRNLLDKKVGPYYWVYPQHHGLGAPKHNKPYPVEYWLDRLGRTERSELIERLQKMPDRKGDVS